MSVATNPRMRHPTPRSNGGGVAPVCTPAFTVCSEQPQRQNSMDHMMAVAAESEFVHVHIHDHEIPASQDLEQQLEQVFEKTADQIDKFALVAIQIVGIGFVFGGWYLSQTTNPY
mmetsp:Transcript_25978/g.46161  ORF Transcript_25978/g.46161 Transcript_25978/m.46161 type:complete len:115 (+) Transcript_25978:209-553(+)|eukprot:CAMPEP_0197517014 /NCGR_PEP_ID=MMETSP1318-20131121/1986_1 /TAXON_ID=552666 /ORGANISM="Partenskyella glossopodia, Strain RCC365" /LENGTH=114 /DNA_ID=CAMNT_0043066241 /DNA_START=209 /DNA_END=556 /DNA_ORIENTATION=-